LTAALLTCNSSASFFCDPTSSAAFSMAVMTRKYRHLYTVSSKIYLYFPSLSK
jgi:hypothetical protein